MYHDDAPMEASHEDDSIWADDAPVQDASAAYSGAQVAQQEWEKLSLRYSDAGYRDGITSGKNARLQAGFDQGFALAAPFARELGSLRGIAASLLTLLTTTSASKYSSPVLGALGTAEGGKEATVAELREVVTALGKLDEGKVLPVDEEAEEHAKSHENEGVSLVMQERREMREMEEMLGGLGGGGAKEDAKKGGLDECRMRLEEILERCGLKGLLPPRRN
ncbi:hypothetical protein BCR35DRAFT_294838 [Leucosporidium creatinivorum]|uniref:Protein YAE1 n=1 Tax=Leucosporidium creatinivorum TaxID=106004 RepID=A0A1Y2E6F1_9BASI|nr:hypothetical protein BCR35DRAFT_294838 [Leucosporidium creatinivorum]